MTGRTKTCTTCGVPNAWQQCDGCGIDVTKQDDAVHLGVHIEGTMRAWLDYCRPCAVKQLPAAVGVGPGSDLPASADPPEKS